jgi:phosphatidylglycerophosphate synthase
MKESLVTLVRRGMTQLAIFLNSISSGKVKPAHITTLSLLGHIPVAWALVTCRPILAAVLLAFFSLMDALDGALARVQNSSTLSGMYYDAVSDRLKEVIVYSALAVFVYKHVDPTIVWQVVALAGTSLLVSYTKAKGEMAIAGTIKDPQKLNRIFGGGIASYEVRVFAVIIGLLFGWIAYILPLLIAANSITIASRFLKVSKQLSEIDAKKIKESR